ncbi:hypothetical protein HDU96_005017 [Phlyctochytrium bullatum]|nr:hypothetical protein HDU96_005017 [Phlyctochytrium bullatum]
MNCKRFSNPSVTLGVRTIFDTNYQSVFLPCDQCGTISNDNCTQFYNECRGGRAANSVPIMRLKAGSKPIVRLSASRPSSNDEFFGIYLYLNSSFSRITIYDESALSFTDDLKGSVFVPSNVTNRTFDLIQVTYLPGPSNQPKDLTETTTYQVTIDDPEYAHWPERVFLNFQGSTTTRASTTGATNGVNPTDTGTRNGGGGDGGSGGLNTIAIISIAVSAVAVLAAFLVAMFVIRRMHRKYLNMAAQMAAASAANTEAGSGGDAKPAATATAADAPLRTPSEGLTVVTQPSFQDRASTRSGRDPRRGVMMESPVPVPVGAERSHSQNGLPWESIYDTRKEPEELQLPPASAPPVLHKGDPYTERRFVAANHPTRRDSSNSQMSHGHHNHRYTRSPSLSGRRPSFDQVSSGGAGWVSAAYVQHGRGSISSHRSTNVYRQQFGMDGPPAGADARSIRSRVSTDFNLRSSTGPGAGLPPRSPSVASGRHSQALLIPLNPGSVNRHRSGSLGAASSTGSVILHHVGAPSPADAAVGVFNDLSSDVSDDGVEVVPYASLPRSHRTKSPGRALSAGPNNPYPDLDVPVATPLRKPSRGRSGRQDSTGTVGSGLPPASPTLAARQKLRISTAADGGSSPVLAPRTASPSAAGPTTPTTPAQNLLASRRSASLERSAAVAQMVATRQRSASRGRDVLAAVAAAPPPAPSAGASPAAYARKSSGHGGAAAVVYYPATAPEVAPADEVVPPGRGRVFVPEAAAAPYADPEESSLDDDDPMAWRHEGEDEEEIREREREREARERGVRAARRG